jgi:hypothetical protein
MKTLRYHYPIERQSPAQLIEADLCIYGGISGGVAAAVQAARMGKRAVIAEFGRHLGGMSSSGLGHTDFGRKESVGGISLEVYRELGRVYGRDEAWQFEPKEAEAVFERWVKENRIPVFFEQRLKSVKMEGGRLSEIEMENGNRFKAKFFIDCSYEGDLMAKAGVSYTLGREANSQYGETLNGVHIGHKDHKFKVPVDPYVVPGDPKSGLLPGVFPGDSGPHGSADKRIQAYNFRLCLTKDPANKNPIPKPQDYDPRRFELGLRYIQAGVWDSLNLHVEMPRGKTDLNNFGGFSTDNIGMNYAWPEAGYEEREKIFQDHVNYQMGWLWFLQNDPRLPEHVRKEAGQWGLPKDEFPESGGWPHQLYVREARRMVSDLVMTEQHCKHQEKVPDSVGLAAYGMDSHNCNRYVKDGSAFNEGNMEYPVAGPFPISYRSIIPKKGECENLAVPVCLSATHASYGSIRMEPVFMVLGQSAATAAVLAMEAGASLQDVDYRELRKRLLDDGQRLEAS